MAEHVAEEVIELMDLSNEAKRSHDKWGVIQREHLLLDHKCLQFMVLSLFLKDLIFTPSLCCPRDSTYNLISVTLYLLDLVGCYSALTLTSRINTIQSYSHTASLLLQKKSTVKVDSLISHASTVCHLSVLIALVWLFMSDDLQNINKQFWWIMGKKIC